MTNAINGIVMKTYTVQSTPSKDDIPKTEDMKVAGKKTMVKAAIIFIDVPSAFASRAMVVLVAASCCVTRLKPYSNEHVQYLVM